MNKALPTCLLEVLPIRYETVLNPGRHRQRLLLREFKLALAQNFGGGIYELDSSFPNVRTAKFLANRKELLRGGHIKNKVS